MGANFMTHQIIAADWDAAVKAAKSYQDDQRHESGHGSYTGHLGTTGGVNIDGRKEFESYEAAEVYIGDKHQKWDSPMLVRIRGTNGYILGGWCPS